jgi:V/A-type H+-transporting ATPase subunit E
MSLDTVVEDIRTEAQERREEILAEAETEAEAIIEEAEADAEATVAQAEAEVEEEIAQERDQAISSANLEAKQRRLEARRDGLATVRSEVESAIADIDGEQRAELTRSLLDAAATEFEDDVPVRVYGRATDEPLLEDILSEYDGWEYAGERECLGGVIVESDESRVRVDNTFDSVLEEVWEDELKTVSSILFDR